MFDADLGDFFIVTVVSNTCRFARRYELYDRFARMVREAGIDLITVEIALGDRQFEVTKPHTPHDVQIRTIEEYWHKESGVDIGINHGRRLWPHKKTVAWIDGDCEPVGRTFRQACAETWHELQSYRIVQMWEWLQPLDYYAAPVGSPNPSFMANYIKTGNPYPRKQPGYPTQWGSPGLAWAANLEALTAIGGVPDAAILGAGDWYLAHMLISDLPIPQMDGYTAGYRHYWLHRQNLCERRIERDVGYVRGMWIHYWHGKTINRGYNTRERILIDNRYDPYTDLKRDHHGLWQLETWEPRQRRMRDAIRAYFRARNEDGIDL
jgi:hypothetical protein